MQVESWKSSDVHKVLRDDPVATANLRGGELRFESRVVVWRQFHGPNRTTALEGGAIRCMLTPTHTAVVAFLEVARFAVEPVFEASPFDPQNPGHVYRASIKRLVTPKIQNESAPLTLSISTTDDLVSVLVLVRPDFADGVHGVSLLILNSLYSFHGPRS